MEKPNMEYLEDLAGDDTVFKQRFIALIKTELPVEIKQYHTNLLNHLLREASEDVHKIKHKINILGLPKSYEIASIHEEELRQGNSSSMLEFTVILETMQKFIKTI
jgi:hypothetical protein